MNRKGTNLDEREIETESICVPMCESAEGFNCTLVCHVMEIEAQTRPRNFLANETEKESKDKFDMRKEECDEMIRIRQRTIRWCIREKKVGGYIEAGLMLHKDEKSQ